MSQSELRIAQEFSNKNKNFEKESLLGEEPNNDFSKN